MPIVIGFEETQYNVDESVGSVEVFVSVFMPVGGQMLVGDVSLVIQSVAGSASKDYTIVGNFLRVQLLIFLSLTFIDLCDYAITCMHIMHVCIFLGFFFFFFFFFTD